MVIVTRLSAGTKQLSGVSEPSGGWRPNFPLFFFFFLCGSIVQLIARGNRSLQFWVCWVLVLDHSFSVCTDSERKGV